MCHQLVDLRSMLDEPSLRRVLALAIGFPTPEKVHQVCQRYRCEPQRQILGVLADGQIIGCIGLGLSQERQIEILHIAVDSQHHRQGIGRWMLEQIKNRHPSCSIVAETDADAVGFYRNCGFVIASLGSARWGVERFACRWEKRP